MTFQPLTDPVDHILLAGQRSPGLAEVLGAHAPRDFDQRRGYGTSGAFLRFRGIPLAEFTVKIRLISDQDWSDWHEWKRLLRRPTQTTPLRGVSGDGGLANVDAGLKPADRQARRVTGGGRLIAPPMTIWHPILEDLEIAEAVVKDVLQPLQTADGEWTVEIRFIEYRRPVRALEETEGPRENAVTDPADQALENLRVLLDEEAAGGSAGNIMNALAPLGGL